MSLDFRCVALVVVAIVLLVVYKFELLDFETTIIGFLILFIFGCNGIMIILLEIRDK